LGVQKRAEKNEPTLRQRNDGGFRLHPHRHKKTKNPHQPKEINPTRTQTGQTHKKEKSKKHTPLHKKKTPTHTTPKTRPRPKKEGEPPPRPPNAPNTRTNPEYCFT